MGFLARSIGNSAPKLVHSLLIRLVIKLGPYRRLSENILVVEIVSVLAHKYLICLYIILRQVILKLVHIKILFIKLSNGSFA